VKTVRDHIASHPTVPAPPPGATHVLVLEPPVNRPARWALTALDGHPDNELQRSGHFADASVAELAGFASRRLGCPVVLSSRFEAEGDVGYYVTPAGGGR
jgi:hypothetical protein